MEHELICKHCENLHEKFELIEQKSKTQRRMVVMPDVERNNLSPTKRSALPVSDFELWSLARQLLAREMYRTTALHLTNMYDSTKPLF